MIQFPLDDKLAGEFRSVRLDGSDHYGDPLREEVGWRLVAMTTIEEIRTPDTPFRNNYSEPAPTPPSPVVLRVPLLVFARAPDAALEARQREVQQLQTLLRESGGETCAAEAEANKLRKELEDLTKEHERRGAYCAQLSARLEEEKATRHKEQAELKTLRKQMSGVRDKLGSHWFEKNGIVSPEDSA